MRTSVLALGFVLILMADGAGAAETEAQQQARRAFEGIEKRFEGLQSIQYAVQRTTSTPQKTVQETWTFALRQPDSFRLHYQVPDERMIVADRNSLWEYLPAARKARHTDLARMSPGDRADLVARTLSKVAVDGIRAGNGGDLVRRTVAVTREPGDPRVIHIEGRDPRFLMAVDTNRCVLLGSELYDKQGELSVQTRTASFAEVQPGFWYPEDIETTYQTGDGHVTTRARFSDIRINAAISNDVFRFVPPRRTEVLEADAAKTK
jgi:outer membrane lipoprotein-sorting protein